MRDAGGVCCRYFNEVTIPGGTAEIAPGAVRRLGFLMEEIL